MRTPGLRTPDWLLTQCDRRLRSSWAEEVCGQQQWRSRFDLGTSALTGGRLRDAWQTLHADTLEWQDWVRDAGEGVSLVPRRVSYLRSTQEIPGAVLVGSVDDAARLCGSSWVSRLRRGRHRAAVLTARFPGRNDVVELLRATDHYSDVDFELLCQAAEWFAAPHPAGLTARQVPVEGMGAKWLDSRLADVRRLAGVDSVDLAPGRPPRVHLTYLDPAYLTSGRRRHDLATLGDVDAVAYRPRVVLISENRDTAQFFPPVPGGIALEGDGRGATAIASLEWVREAPVLVYWGDMDAAGLEILHEFRAAGLPVRSILMDLSSYERWQRYGVDHDHAGRPIRVRSPRELPLLREEEQRLYGVLCSADWRGPRRIEQERIPLAVAAAALNQVVRER